MNQVLTGTSFAKMRHERGFATPALVPLPPQVVPAPSTYPPNVPEATTYPILTERGSRHDGPARELLETRRMVSGAAYTDIGKERESDLIARYKAGDRYAGEALLLVHKRIIANIAKRCLRRSRCHDLEFGDLSKPKQLGNVQAIGYQESVDIGDFEVVAGQWNWLTPPAGSVAMFEVSGVLFVDAGNRDEDVITFGCNLSLRVTGSPETPCELPVDAPAKTTDAPNQADASSEVSKAP